jgi:hypothetical protein
MVFDRLGENFDRSLALIGAFLSILLIIYMVLFVSSTYVLVGLFVLGSCLIWVFARKRGDLREISYSYHAPIAKFFNLLSYFFIFASIGVLLLNSTPYIRPLDYFIFTSLAVCSIAFEILYTRGNKSQIYSTLFKIILIGLSLELSEELIFPGQIGVDPWYHQTITATLLNLAHIPSGTAYTDFPVFHIEMGSTMLITGLSYKISSMFGSMCQVILSAVFIFFICKFIFPKSYNMRLGLLAALLVTIANYHVEFGSLFTPNTLGWIFVVMLVYLLFFYKGNGSNKMTITIIMMGALIFTHTLAAFQVVLLSAICWAVYYFHVRLHIDFKGAQFPRKLVIIFAIGMLTLWIYAFSPLNTLVSLVLAGFNQDFFTPSNPGIIGYATSIPVIEQILNLVPLFLFFALSIVGFFYMISKKYGSYLTRVIALMGIVPLAISFFVLIGGGSIMEDRWWYLAELICAIPASIPLLLIIKIKIKPLKIVIFAGLVLFLSFFMIISPTSNIDNATFSPNSNVRYALTNSELQSLNLLFSKWNGSFASDQYYGKTVIADLGYPTIFLDQELYDKNFSATPANTLVLIRSEIASSPIVLFSGVTRLNYDPSTHLQVPTFDKVYDCNSVSGYLRISRVI